MIQQIKHETGHVQFRVLREKLIGRNSLHLSGSTPAPTSAFTQADGERRAIKALAGEPQSLRSPRRPFASQRGAAPTLLL